MYYFSLKTSQKEEYIAIKVQMFAYEKFQWGSFINYVSTTGGGGLIS